MMSSESVSIAVPGYSEIAPTQFNIQICIARTTYEVRRRYSDFVEFSKKIEQEMGEAPPVALPAKKWIGNKSREFLDERRRGLESFLRGIAKSDEWRESLAFQQFLEVSKHVKPRSSQATKKGDWVKGTAEARELIQQAMKASSSTEQRRFVVLARAKIHDLEASLAGDSELGDGEYRRRRDTLQEMNRTLLGIKSQQLGGIPGAFVNSDDSHLFASKKSNNNSDRSPRSTPRVLGGGAETSRTRDKNNQGLLQMQQEDMVDQDQVIENLRQMIGRQKQLGEEINDELVYQNALLDELDNDTHVSSARLNQAKRRVGKFT